MKKVYQAQVVQDEAKPVAHNVLAQAIIEISTAMNKLLKTGLSKDAIITLVADRVKVHGRFGKKPGKRDIESVINALANLQKEFVR